MSLINSDKLIEELESLEKYFEEESNHPDDGLANPQRYRDTMSGVAQGLNHAIIVVLDMVENQRYEIANTESAYIIPDGVGGWKRADEKEVNIQYTTDTK